MNDLLCFVAVEFVDDPNVSGWTYWYLCGFDGIKDGDCVVAPLGRHDKLQKGIVRCVKYASEEEAPFPMHSIKRIKKIFSEKSDV